MGLPAEVPEPRVAVIEGRRVLVVERRPPLPPTLEGLRRSMAVSWSTTITRQGARTECVSDQDHRLFPIITGRHVGLDGVVRDLRLSMCQDCEAVEVRDVSYDRLPTATRQFPRRRDHVIGWYSGARRNQRTYGRAT
jgi:hypothetical protein